MSAIFCRATLTLALFFVVNNLYAESDLNAHIIEYEKALNRLHASAWKLGFHLCFIQKDSGLLNKALDREEYFVDFQNMEVVGAVNSMGVLILNLIQEQIPEVSEAHQQLFMQLDETAPPPQAVKIFQLDKKMMPMLDIIKELATTCAQTISNNSLNDAGLKIQDSCQRLVTAVQLAQETAIEYANRLIVRNKEFLFQKN